MNLERQRRLNKQSFYEFFKYFWDVLVDAPLVDNWHIKYLCDELQILLEAVINNEQLDFDTLIINIPPGTTKSTIATIALPVYGWTRKPSLRFITGSYASSLAIDHAVYSRDLIRSEKFMEMYPHLEIKEDKDNKTGYENTLKGGRYPTSVGGAVTGKHSDLIIVDDPHNPKKAESEVERTTANRWFDQTLMSRKINKETTPTIVIMQRLNEDDLTGHLLAKKGKRIKHVCLPGELSDDIMPLEIRKNYIDGLLDPVRLSRNALETMRVDLGTYGYAGQIQQTPAPAEGYEIKKAWFKIERFDNLPRDIVRLYRADTAYGKEHSDRSAVLCYSLHEGELYLWEIWKSNLPLPEFLEQFKNWLKATHYSGSSKVKIEPKASGIDVVQTMRGMEIEYPHQINNQITEIVRSKINIMEDKSPTDSKETRVKAASPKIEAGFVHLNIGFDWEDFLLECSKFPKAKYDDQVDVLAATILEELVNRPMATVQSAAGFGI